MPKKLRVAVAHIGWKTFTAAKDETFTEAELVKKTSADVVAHWLNLEALEPVEETAPASAEAA